MTRVSRQNSLGTWTLVLWLGVCSLFAANALGGETTPEHQMPAHWKEISDFLVPAEQVKAMSNKLDANLSSVRNVVYNVNGKRVQLNIIVTQDSGNAEKLMAKLRTMKAEEALLQKGLTVYEFVGQNNVLPEIAEGRKHLNSM